MKKYFFLCFSSSLQYLDKNLAVFLVKFKWKHKFNSLGDVKQVVSLKKIFVEANRSTFNMGRLINSVNSKTILW